MKIDIRDKRVRGGRLTLDAKTDSKVERNRRESAVRDLLDQGEYAILEGIRSRQLDIADVAAAHRLKEPARSRALKALRIRVTGEHGPTLLEGVDRVMPVVRATRAPRTADLYQRLADQMLAHFEGDRLMADIMTSDATEYLTSPKATNGGGPWGAGQQNNARMLGSIVWQRIIDDEDERAEREGRAPTLTRNVWRLADAAPMRQSRVEFLRPEEWIVLRDKVRGLPSAALIALGCRAGLRAEEATYLRPGIDLDLERGVIHVRSRSGRHAWRPKSKHSNRDVPIPDDLREILLEHEPFMGRSYVLHTPGRDAPISHTLVIKWTRAAFEASGIKYGRKKDALTFHSLRHTYASWLTQKGMHPKKVARLIGDRPEMVLKVYGHLAEDDHDEAVRLLNQVISENNPGSSGEKSGGDND